MRLIDADELNEYIGREALDTREKIFALVHRMPTVEPKQGEWIDLSDGWQEGTFMCSSCQMEFVLIEGTPEDNEYNFCPNCGASMVKGE